MPLCLWIPVSTLPHCGSHSPPHRFISKHNTWLNAISHSIAITDLHTFILQRLLLLLPLSAQFTCFFLFLGYAPPGTEPNCSVGFPRILVASLVWFGCRGYINFRGQFCGEWMKWVFWWWAFLLSKCILCHKSKPAPLSLGHQQRLREFLCREYYVATSWTVLIQWLNRFWPWDLLLQHFLQFSLPLFFPPLLPKPFPQTLPLKRVLHVVLQETTPMFRGR